MAHLRNPEVIQHAKRGMERIHRISFILYPSNSNLTEMINIRVVLTMNMIVFFSKNVFEQMGELENELLVNSRRLFENTETIITNYNTGVQFFQMPQEVVKGHAVLLRNFIKSFSKWKKIDENKLLNRIRYALVALYAASTHAPDALDDTMLRREFKTQIVRLRKRLVAVGGDQALLEFDEQQRCPHQLLETDALELNNAIASDTPLVSNVAEAQPYRMNPEQLAHELLINPEFRLDGDGLAPYMLPSQGYSKLRNTFGTAFWESIAEDLAGTPSYTRVVNVLKEISDAIRDCRTEIECRRLSEVLNLDEITAMIGDGPLSWDFIVSMVRGLQAFIVSVTAPLRVKETETLFEEFEPSLSAETEACRIKAFTTALRYFLGRVNAMRIDNANARLAIIEPIMRVEGLQYEFNKFQKKVEDGIHDLHNVNAWLIDHVEQVDKPGELLLDPSKLRSFIAGAVVDLVCSEARQISLPCTLMIDSNRLHFAHREIRFLATACAVVLHLRQHLHDHYSNALKQLLDRTVDYFQKTDIVDVGYDSYSDAMIRHAYSSLDQPIVDSYVLRARNLFDPANPIQRVAAKRIKHMLVTYLQASQDAGVDAPMDYHDLLVLDLFKPRHAQVGRALHEVMGVHLLVHASTYRSVIERVIQTLNTRVRDPPVGALALVAPVITINVEVALGNTMPIMFYHADDASERYSKATVGLIHAKPGSLEFTQLLGIRDAAAREGGFPL